MIRPSDQRSLRSGSASSRPDFHNQQGYLVISLMIVLFVTAALLTLYVERRAERSRLDRGEQIGFALGTIGAGLDAYLDQFHATLVSDRPSVPRVVNPLAPTAEELIRKVGIAGVAPRPPLIPGASYRVSVSFPGDCTAEHKQTEHRCRPTGLVYIDKPLERGRRADYVALARAARVMNGRGGYSRLESASHFTFPDSAITPATIPIANPTRSPGVLAWRAQALPEAQEYLMTNGGNRMNNTLRLDGEDTDHDLVGARNITASGTVTAHGANIQGNATVIGRLEVFGGTPGVNWGATIENDALIKGDLRVGGQIRANQLLLTSRYGIGDRCTTFGALGSSPDGTVLQCRDTWKRLIDSPILKTYSWTANAPTGFLAELTKYREPLGDYIFCRTSKNDEWYDAEDKTWRVGVRGNSGAYEVFCYGAL